MESIHTFCTIWNKFSSLQLPGLGVKRINSKTSTYTQLVITEEKRFALIWNYQFPYYYVIEQMYLLLGRQTLLTSELFYVANNSLVSQYNTKYIIY